MIKNSKGFTLVEMSIVLVIIGVILGAVSIGKDLQRNATYQKISQSFIQGWALAYQNHFNRVNLVIADNPLSPTLMVNQNNGEICGDTLPTTLYTFMDSAGIRMPAGRAEGSEDKYVYLDSNGNPQQIEICFDNVPWSVDDSSAPTGYSLRNKNVMVIKGITPDLARLLDNSVDGIADARFGYFREMQYANNTSINQRVWSKTNTQDFANNNINQDESQVAIMTTYYLMPE
ncbi:MAG: prepilin-type N-terminal cleavage/methylation domain-containing protein [Alcanivoracaceae bacterium]|nr:prepilin-type N-terminal cleavage/methylation domain-containing protein [Alcanivoracaceae bacterium]